MTSYSLPRLYSDTETASILGISVPTVRRKRRRGELGHVLIGRKVYTAEDQIKDLIRRGRRDAGAVVKDAEVDGRLQSGTSVARSGMRSLIEHDVDSDGLGQAYSLAERAGEGVP